MKSIIFWIVYKKKYIKSTSSNNTRKTMPKKQQDAMIKLNDQNKSSLLSFFQRPTIIQKVLVNHINNRNQDFPDPITSTLILMVSSPMQIEFCELGIVLFKTNNLPVLPYTLLNEEESKFIKDVLSEIDNSMLTETYYGCGKFSVQLNIGRGVYLPKKSVLLAFVRVMQKQKDFKEICILQRLSDIIIQRFLSTISVHPDDISEVMEKIWGPEQNKQHIV